MKNKVQKIMSEKEYRASRVCRVIGNPTAYRIIKILGKSEMTPSQLSKKLKLSIFNVSNTLRHLREIDVVRYETKKNEKVYWLKEPTILKILSELEKYTEKLKKIKK